VLESFRFGGDRREALLDILTTIERDGRRIDVREAEMLVNGHRPGAARRIASDGSVRAAVGQTRESRTLKRRSAN
jgi:hypothetical protein